LESLERDNFSRKVSRAIILTARDSEVVAIIIESAKAAEFDSGEMRCGRPIKFEKWLAARRSKKERDAGRMLARG